MNNLFEKIKLTKKTKILLIAALSLLGMIIYFFPDKSNNNADGSISNNTKVSYTNEEQLEKVLGNIKGAGKVAVMITYETSGEEICANNTEIKTSTVTEKSENGGIKESETITENKSPVTVQDNNGEQALVIVEKEPKVKGVIVVAEGADNINVKLSLQKAVETVLQIEPSQVEIFAMN